MLTWYISECLTKHRHNKRQAFFVQSEQYLKKHLRVFIMFPETYTSVLGHMFCSYSSCKLHKQKCNAGDLDIK